MISVDITAGTYSHHPFRNENNLPNLHDFLLVGPKGNLGGGFIFFLFSALPGEMIRFD